MQLDLGAVRHRHLVDHARRGRDQVEVELAAEAFLDDLEVEQAEEAAAETHAERGRGFHLPGEGGVVEAQLAHRRAQVVEVARVHREQAAEDHRLHFLVAGQCFVRGSLVLGDRVADGRVADFLDRGDEIADLARAEGVGLGELRIERADLVDLVDAAGAHHADRLLLLQHALMDAHDDDDAEIGVVIGVHQRGLERGGNLAALRRGQLGDDGFQHVRNAEAGLGGNLHGVRGVEADDLLDLLLDARHIGGRQVDLVEHGDDLVVLVDRLVDVRQRLGLDALRGIHHQQRAFAGGQAPAHLIGEVYVSRRVHQVQRIGLAVIGLVGQAHGLRLDGDAALLLDIHRIEHLFAHFAVGQAAAGLDQPVGEGRFAMVDMGNDREIADFVAWGHGRHIAGEAGCGK